MSCFVTKNFKGGVGNFGETSSSALEFENTQPEKICHFLIEPLLQHTRTRTWPMRARDKFVHRWKADRQVGHPVILAGPAKMIPYVFISCVFYNYLNKPDSNSLLVCSKAAFLIFLASVDSSNTLFTGVPTSNYNFNCSLKKGGSDSKRWQRVHCF